MSYRAGTRGLDPLGIASGEPRIICDGCGATHPISVEVMRAVLARHDRKGEASDD